MKVQSINLNAYQAMNSIKPAANPNSQPVQQAQTPANIKGANFIDRLNEQEINFLNNNFVQADAVTSAANKHVQTEVKHKIDIWA